MTTVTATALTLTAEGVTVPVDRIVVDLAENRVHECLCEGDDPEGNAPTANREAVRAAFEARYPGTPIEVSYDWEANNRQQHIVAVEYDDEGLDDDVRCRLAWQTNMLAEDVLDGLVADAIGRCVCDGAWEGATGIAA